MERGACRAFRSLLASQASLALSETDAQNRLRIAVPAAESFPFEVYDGVAVIDIQGSILQRATWRNLYYAEYLGCCVTEYLSYQFDIALSDSTIKAILFRVNTPGGQAAGMDSFSEKVFAARGIKPIVAHVDGMNCSGGYYFTSPCDAIFSTRDSTHGNIGTYLGFYNLDKMLEEAGIVEYEFVSSVSPDKVPDETTPEGAALYQEHIDALGQNFVDAVARNRGISSADVIKNYGNGWIKVGKSALDAGMIDGLGSFESVLTAMVNDQTPAQIQAQFSGGVIQMLRNSLKLPLSILLGGQQVHATEIEVEGQTASSVPSLMVPPVVAPAAAAPAPAVQPVATLGGMSEVEILALREERTANRIKIAAGFAQKHSAGCGGDKREAVEAQLSKMHLAAQESGLSDELEKTFSLLPSAHFGGVLPAAQLENAQVDALKVQLSQAEKLDKAAKSVMGEAGGELDKDLYTNIPAI